MSYWLFSIMYDWYPETWPKMVRMGIAAQQYPVNWCNERKNVKHLTRVKRGDRIVAALHKHRFAGYGTATSDFYRGGPSMKFQGRNGNYDFQDRVDCHWTVLPLGKEPEYIKLDALKKRGFDIDLTVGLCIKQIDKRSFEALKRELDKAGAKSEPVGSLAPAYFATDIRQPPERVGVTISRIIRDTLRSLELKKQYDYACQVCGLRLKVSRGRYYAEVHHIRPLGGAHRGFDDESNMLVLCPNHHALFDLGVPEFIERDGLRIGSNEFRLTQRHGLDSENLKYHNKTFRG